MVTQSIDGLRDVSVIWRYFKHEYIVNTHTYMCTYTYTQVVIIWVVVVAFL